MSFKQIGIFVAIWLVASILWANFVRDEFPEKNSQTRPHHSIACRFQLEGLLIGIKDFKARTNRFPARLEELYPIELQRVPICPLTGSSYNKGYDPTTDSQDFVIRCSTGRGPVFTSKDLVRLKGRAER